MFIGDFEKTASWSHNAVKGCKRFLDRIWNLAEDVLDGDGISAANETMVHRAIKKVGSDIESLKFNTAIATLMALVNEFYENAPSRGDIKILLMMLSPFAPHIAEELWEKQGFAGYAATQAWPQYDESKTLDARCEIAVQLDGKLRSTVIVDLDADDQTVLDAAKSDEKISRLIDGKEIIRIIVVKNKLINLIINLK